MSRASRRKRISEPYRHRDELLLSLGFATYRSYVASELWASIRARVLDRDGHKCTACGKPASQVHHLKYDEATMLGTDMRRLTSLCCGCHKGIEFGKYGKTTMAQASKRLRRKRKRTARNVCWESDPEYRRMWRQISDAKAAGDK